MINLNTFVIRVQLFFFFVLSAKSICLYGVKFLHSNCFKSPMLQVLNDNYCDCEDGSDEPLTSACSGRTHREFYCDDFSNTTVHFSKVNDGICDCCNGFDEVDSMSCPNKCTSTLIKMQDNLLERYNVINNGNKVKNNLLDAYRKKKQQEQQKLTNLEDLRDQVKSLYVRIRKWLEVESEVEGKVRLKEVKRKVRLCATGYLEQCDIYDDDIILYNDNPSIIATGETVSASRSRLSYIQSYSSLEKLDICTCEVEVNVSFIDDKTQKDTSELMLYNPVSLNGPESLRVHKFLRVYLEHAEGRGGRAERNLNVEQVRRKTTLFGRFLDSGDEGRQEGMQLLCELAGVMLSPVIVPLHTVGYVSYSLFRYLQRYISRCHLDEGVSGVEEVDVSLKEVAREIGIKDEGENDKTKFRSKYDDVVRAGRVDNGDTGDTVLAKTLAVAERIGKYVMDVWGKSKAFLEEKLAITCDNVVLNSAAYVYLQSQNESSYLSQAIELTDYTRYGPLVAVQKRIFPIYHRLRYYVVIAYMAPVYLFRFYFTGAADRLPVFRNACILRRGLHVARSEMKSIQSKIDKMKEELQQNEAYATDGSGKGVQGQGYAQVAKKGSSSKRSTGTKSKALVEAENIVYGMDGEWELLKDVCMEKAIDSYVYKLCVFKEVKQDRTLLGAYSGWGINSPEAQDHGSGAQSNSKTGMKALGQAIKKINTMFESPNKPPLSHKDFLVQRYANGAMCHNKREREVEVQYSCGAQNEILEVVEVEVCSYKILALTPVVCNDVEVADMYKSYVQISQYINMENKRQASIDARVYSQADYIEEK